MNVMRKYAISRNLRTLSLVFIATKLFFPSQFSLLCAQHFLLRVSLYSMRAPIIKTDK